MELFIMPRSLLTVFFAVVICFGGATNVTTCLQRWDCKWEGGIPFVRTEVSCEVLRDGYYPTDGQSVAAPPGPCNLLVKCRRHMDIDYAEMFECLKLITIDAAVKSLDIERCGGLEIRSGNLDHFTDMEAFRVSYSSIKRMDDEIFYETDRLMTVDIFQDYEKDISFDEYPAALIGPYQSPNVSYSSFLPNLRQLILQNFALNSGIPINAFQNLGHLEMLIFRYVNLTDEDLQSMHNLKNLTHFEIYDDPQLYVLPIGFSTFMPELCYFELSMTSISSITEDHLSSYHKLETLILGNNLIDISQKALENLSELRELSLNGNGRLTSLPYFGRIEHIEMIDVGHCSISNLDLERFSNLGHLKVFKLDHNRLKVIPTIFANFPEARSPVERIETVDLSWNEIVFLTEYAFSNLASLKSIDLRGNKIVYVHFRAFFNLKILSEVDLARNAIVAMHPESFFQVNTLQKLDLYGNKLTNFVELKHVNWPDEANPGVSSLPLHPFETNMFSNLLQCNCDMFRDMFTRVGNDEWELSYYHAYVWPGSFELANQVFSRHQSLTCKASLDGYPTIDFMLDHPEKFYSEIARTDEECPSPCICIRKCTTNLAYAVCDDGDFTEVPEALGSSINFLFLRRNNITMLYRESFARLTGLITLDMTENDITYIEPNTFYHLSNLEVLSISNNSLTRIGPEEFNISSSHFRTLNLSSNLIHEIDKDSFRAINTLRALHLANNELETFPQGVLDNLVNLTNLTVSGNPFNCTCDMLYLTDWYIQVAFGPQKQFYSDVADIGCAPFSNETELYRWMEQKTVACTPPPAAATVVIVAAQPYRWTGLVIAVASTMIMTTVIGLVIYRYRLEILVVIYIRTGLKFFEKDTRNEDAEKEFDAFLSFSSLDRDFVFEDLIPKLESQENRRKLCIHHRDFIAGECIATNIINAIENSRKIVILCSKNYLESEWCSYEFKTAHQRALKERSRRVVLIMMEHLEKDIIDKEIKAYISTNTYLDKKDPLFWSKLLYSVPGSKPDRPQESDTNVDSGNVDSGNVSPETSV